MIGTFFYLVKQGFANIWKNKLMFLASVLIVVTSMLTLGIFTIIGKNADNFVDNIKNEQVMVAFIKDEVGDDENRLKEIKRKIELIEGIDRVEFESKETALANARERYFDENNVSLTEGWDDNNMMSDSYLVYLTDLSKGDAVAEQIKQIQSIRSIRYNSDIFVFVTNAANILKVVSIILFVLLVGISFLVISNTIKLVLHARRKEIGIMKYIGATDSFIKLPFVIEGIIVGVVGAVISWQITISSYALIEVWIKNKFMTVELLPMNLEILNINLVIGVLVGIFSSMMSIKKYLKV